MRGATMLLAVVGVLVAAPAWADFEAGMDAYLRGDYTTALKEFRALAEQGNAPAQNNLGLMYAKGQGVPKDYVQAYMWLSLAAAQGDAQAQHNLGLMYAEGQGVPQDFVRAHMWWNLAAAQGNEPARKLRDILAEGMTPAQLAKAERLAREWKPKSE